jgi:hypothetical protein
MRVSLDLNERHAARGNALTLRGWTGQTVEVACASPDYAVRLEKINRPQEQRRRTMQ